MGLGLIGGSYARALSRQGFPVNAIDTDPKAIRFAIDHNLIVKGDTQPASHLIEEADFLIFGLYPTLTADWILAEQSRFQSGCYLTDVSGVKRAIVTRIQQNLRPDVEFVPSHPMAGREVGGVWNSDDRIFQSANFIITPTQKNTPEGISLVHELAECLGFSRISELSIDEHDQMVGYLSQLTHAIAVSLMNANANPHLVEYTGDSFRDLTRIAKINEVLWSELFSLNKDILIPEIDGFISALNDLKEKLSQGDEGGLKELFIQSALRRQRFDK